MSSSLCAYVHRYKVISVPTVTGEDYFRLDNIELTFMSGSPAGTMRNAMIVITDDTMPEGAETFMVNLVSRTRQVTLGNPSSATVVIVGDDGEFSVQG